MMRFLPLTLTVKIQFLWNGSSLRRRRGRRL